MLVGMERKTIKTIREKAGLTQRELARAMDRAESTVRHWDQGRSVPTISAVDYPKFLKLLKCTPEQLSEAALQSRKEFECKQGKDG